MAQGFNEFMGSIGQIGSRVQLVQGFNLCNGSNKLVQGFYWFVGSIGSRVHWAQWLNRFKRTISSRV